LVLRRAADERGLVLSEEVMDYMLTRFARDLASLMQLLQQLDDYALRAQRAVTIPLIKSMLDGG
jgi:DnaA family protein